MKRKNCGSARSMGRSSLCSSKSFVRDRELELVQDFDYTGGSKRKMKKIFEKQFLRRQLFPNVIFTSKFIIQPTLTMQMGNDKEKKSSSLRQSSSTGKWGSENIFRTHARVLRMNSKTSPRRRDVKWWAFFKCMIQRR